MHEQAKTTSTVCSNYTQKLLMNIAVVKNLEYTHL